MLQVSVIDAAAVASRAAQRLPQPGRALVEAARDIGVEHRHGCDDARPRGAPR
jgi:hypothetical protein